MNRNFYLNFIATLLLIVLSFVGFVLIKSIDILSLRTENLSGQISKIDAKFASLGTALKNRPASLPSTAEEKKITADKILMANSEFYDKNAIPGGSFIAAIASETKNMNYTVNNEKFVSDLWSYTCDSLADRNYQNFEIFEPQLAESWTISEDKLVYTIKLKKGVLWHDFKDPVSGKEWKNIEVTAHDFKFYVDVLKNPDTDCAPSRVYLQDLDRIEVINDYEFKVYWKKRYFQSESITLGTLPLPRHLYHAYEGPFDGKKFNDDHERNRIIVGCGPYRFDKWEKGQRIILKKWDKYYGAKYGVSPAVETLVFDVIKHPNTRFQSFLSGTINDISLSPEQWIKRTNGSEFGPQGTLRKIKYPGRAYSYIGYNLKNPLFQDKRVRQALTSLVNRERILKEVYHGLGRITTGTFFIDSPYYDKSIKPYPFSIERAKALFKEAGWKDEDGDGILEKDGKKFEFTIFAPSGSEIIPKMLPIIKEDMAKAGVIMKIQNIEWSVYVQRLEKKKYEVCVLSWALGLSPDPYQLWHSSEADKDGSSNHIGFKNPEADKLIEEIRETFDMKKRVELCHRFHKLLHEEQPYTFLISPDSLQGISGKFQNIRVFPLGVPVKLMWLPLADQNTAHGTN
ncbi:MAG: hypothetical protein A2017_02455 [Lentisphaerae bacterium GWF2_44_16]|nr:MAG: hypothetical protein A2017_02455 [Lentisphaerae bacterium GWF2_44_16]